jgi:hypothetical protein
MRRHKHETVEVRPPERLAGILGADGIAIDAKLAPLIRLLWAHDILTYQCCEERYPGLAWIVFPGTVEVGEFLDVAQRHYRVDVETWEDGVDGELCIGVNLFVLFPTADIPRLVRAFEELPREGR